MKDHRRFRRHNHDPTHGAILAHLPTAVYATDNEGWITFYNEAAVEFAGRRPKLGSDRWCVTWRLRHPEGGHLPHEQCPMALSLQERRPIRGVETIAERPDGTLVPFMPNPTPIFDSSGLLVGAVNMLFDMTAQKEAEERERMLRGELYRTTAFGHAMNLASRAGEPCPLVARGEAALARSRKLLDATDALVAKM